MNALMTEAAKPLMDFDLLKSKLKTTWMTGNYDYFSRFMQLDAETFFRRMRVKPGSELLDIGCGAGQLALIAARSGVKATGCDIATNWLENARTRAVEEGLRDVLFDEGDAEDLPYRDAQFDAVASLIGAMFAPRPERVASEMIRVCNPGGLIAMANWTPSGFVGQMFRVIAKHIAPSGMPSPVLWGDEATVRARLANGTKDMTCIPRVYHFDYPFSPAGVVEFFRVNYGPMAKAFASLDISGQGQLRDELTTLWSGYNTAKDGTTRVEAEYLEVMATKS